MGETEREVIEGEERGRQRKSVGERLKKGKKGGERGRKVVEGEEKGG